MTATVRLPANGDPARDPLWTDLTDMIRYKAVNHERNLQVALGPSEVGHPCMRRLAYGLMQAPECNPDWDCLPSAYGIAMHTWLEAAANEANDRLGYARWITERRVEIIPGLSGTADLYDTETHTVIDWKNLGYTTFHKYRKDVGPTYSNQVQLYGRGYKRLGYPVARVAIAILPRTGTLSKMHLEYADYSDEIVDQVLARREEVIRLLSDLDVENNPERFAWFETTPDTCIFCPWWRPYPSTVPTPFECDGKPTKG